MKHVAVYFRVSTDEQDISSQVSAIESYTHTMVTKVYKDEGISGSHTRRPGYQAMLQDVRAGLVSEVVVFALDRLGRNSKECIQRIFEFEECGAGFTSVTQPMFNTNNPLRNTMVSLFADIAQIERNNIRERVKAGMKVYKARRGYIGPVSTLTPERRTLIHNLRATGKSLRAIAIELGVSHGLIQKALA